MDDDDRMVDRVIGEYGGDHVLMRGLEQVIMIWLDQHPQYGCPPNQQGIDRMRKTFEWLIGSLCTPENEW